MFYAQEVVNVGLRSWTDADGRAVSNILKCHKFIRACLNGKIPLFIGE